MRLGMFNLHLIANIAFTLFLARDVVSENILFVHTCSSYSHRSSEWPIVEALAEKGHNITFMGPFPHKHPSTHPNITDIVPFDLNNYFEEIMKSNFDVSHRAKGIVPPMWLVIDFYCYSTCDVLLQSAEFQNWISTTPQVDLVIADVAPECAHGLSQALKSKSMMIFPIPTTYMYSDIFGTPHEASSIPDIDIGLKTPLPLWKRVIGNVLPLWFKLVKDIFYSFFYTSMFKNHLRLENQASYDEMNANLSLVLVNADYLEDYTRSEPPFIVKVPGLHVKSKDQLMPLDSEIELFINSANSTNTKPEGFIYISLGTVVNAGSMPHKIRDVFFDTIKRFPNIRFVWRWTGEFPEKSLMLPENLLLRSWVDQQALLAHPKVKGFVFQAGRPSMEEAMRFGVPTIAFPMVCDQDFNSYRLEMLESSITLELTDLQLKSELLHESIEAILTNPKYKANAQRIMNLAADVPMPPVEKAVWWIEYVLRHTQEDLNLLKPLSQKLTWYERRDLDVWAIITFIVYIAIRIIVKVARILIQKLFKTSSTALNHLNRDIKIKKN